MTQSSDNTQPSAIPAVTLGWRIQMALAHGGLKQTDLMDYFELSRGTISRWCRDESIPKRHHLQQIALMCGVPFKWLETGESPHQGDPGGGGKECPQPGSNRRPADYKSHVLAFPARPVQAQEIAA